MSYGVPLASPIVDYAEYEESLAGYEEPVETYAVPAADTFSGYSGPAVVSSTYSPPATLPDNWPSYPSPALPSPSGGQMAIQCARWMVVACGG